MTTKSKKRGRKRHDAPRTPSGQKSRSRFRAKEPSENMQIVGFKARERVHGLPSYLASHEKASTALGRLWLRGEITEPMRQAGEKYLEVYESAMKAINAPVGLRTKTAGDSGDEVSDDYIEWAIAAVARYEALKAALRDNGCFVAIHYLVVEDDDCCDQVVVRWGLRCLAHKLGIA